MDKLAFVSGLCLSEWGINMIKAEESSSNVIYSKFQVLMMNAVVIPSLIPDEDDLSGSKFRTITLRRQQ